MANEEVRINLTSSADTKGFDQIGAASKSAGVGIEASAKSSKELSAELGRSVEAGSATVGLFQNIATASQGGAAGIAAAARAGLGFGQVMKNLLAGAGPLGLALAGLGTVASLMVAALSKPKDSVDKLSESFKLSKKSADDLDKASFENIKDSVGKLNTELAESLKLYDAIAESNERIAQAADDAAKAEIGKRKAAGLLTDEQASAGEKAIETRATSRGLNKQSDRTAFEARQVADALAKAEQIASEPLAEYDFFANRQYEIEARLREAQQDARAKQEAQARLLSNKNRLGVSLGFDAAGSAYATEEQMQAWRRDKAAFDEVSRRAAQSSFMSRADYAPGGATDLGGDASQTRAELVADRLKKAEEKWRASDAAVESLSKRSRELAEKMALETKTREEIARINAESKRTLGQIKGMTPEHEARERARLAGLSRDQLANQLAGQTEFASPKLLAERLAEINAANPKLKPLGYSPAAPAQPGPLGAPGTITMPDGTIVPVNRAQPGAGGGTITGPGGISRTFAPGGVQGQGRGAYREGDQAADAIKGATEAVKSSDTGDSTAKAAAELKAAEEQRAAAVQSSTQQTVSALGDIISMSQETASVLGKHTTDIASLRAEIQSLRASVRAANRK